MKKTARRILAALLMASLLLTSGISSVAATEAPETTVTHAEAEGTAEEQTVSASTEEADGDVTPQYEVSSIAENTEADADAPEQVDETDAPDAVEELPEVLGETRDTIIDAPEDTDKVDAEVVTSEREEEKANEEKANEENPLSDAMVISTTTYNGVTVEVSADEGVLPSDAHLFVAEIKHLAGKATAENALDHTDIEYDDYMLLDIQIRNGENKEIEPEGEVAVNIMMDADKLPEDADASTLEIHHLEENSRGEVEAVRTVADNGSMTSGSVDINGANMEANFTVPSFSLFTITWSRGTNSGEHEDATMTRLVFEAYLYDDAMAGFQNDGYTYDIPGVQYTDWDIKKDYSFDLSNNVDTITIAQIMQDNRISDTIEKDGKIYNLQSVIYKNKEFDALRHDPWDKAKISKGGTLFGNIRVLKDGKEVAKMPFGNGDQTIQFIYIAKDELHPVESVKTTTDGDAVRDVIQMYMYKFTERPEATTSGSYYKDNVTTYTDANGNKVSKHARGQITPNLASAMIPQGKEAPDLNIGRHKNPGDPDNWEAGETLWFDKNGKGRLQGTQVINGVGSFGKAAEQVDGLFVKDIYDKYGYFYYGSDEYGAELHDGTFQLYEEVMSPAHNNADVAYFWRRGNFLPYNTIKADEVVAVTEHDMSGNPLQPGDKLYHKPVYAVNGSHYKVASGQDDTRGIFSFGMSVQATFFQPTSGLRKNPSTDNMDPMVFQFNGDDDFWLYLDDVRILDLGGNHDAQEGFIDFSTGKVYWTNNGSWKENGIVYSDQSARSRSFINYKGEQDIMYYDGETTIKDLFIEAYRTTYGYTKQQAVAAVDALRCWNGNTFKDGTVHTMKIFYMEHGSGASNLRMMFNIPVQPVSDLTVSKAFVENGKPMEVPEDFVATFEVYELKRANGTGGDYVSAELVSSVELNKETAYDETFTREVINNKAVFKYNFKNLPVSHEYVVVEKIYRTDEGFLGAVYNKAGGTFKYDETMTDAEREAIERLIPETKKTLSVTDNTGKKDVETKPVYMYVSNIVEMQATGAEPSVLNVENHYQMTLTVEKHVHSQNTEDIEKDYRFRLYLRMQDGQGGYTYYTEPLYIPKKIGSRNPEDWGWDEANATPAMTVAAGKNYYEFTLKDLSVKDQTTGKSLGRITVGVPSGYEAIVEEFVGDDFRVFRPFINIFKVERDQDGNVIPNGEDDVMWRDAPGKVIPVDAELSKGEAFKSTPVESPLILDDDAKVVFINERQIVRTGVALNSAPFMMMLAVVFMAAAGLCVKYLHKKNEELDLEADLFDL